MVPVQQTELVAPSDTIHLYDRLDQLQLGLFSHIPGLPSPSVIDHILVIINKDLSGIAYVNELNIVAEVRVTRDVKAGTPVFASDISDISSIDLGVEIPDNAAIVFVRSAQWKKSLFFDFSPINNKGQARNFDVKKILAQQALLLLGLPAPTDDNNQSISSRLSVMRKGVVTLRKLLEDKCEEESTYQELLADNAWMLGGSTQISKDIMSWMTKESRILQLFVVLTCITILLS